MTSIRVYCPSCDRTYERGGEGASDRCANDGTRLVRLNEDPLLGRTLDERFRLDARIGSGGMGAVYRAWQTSVGRPVAVKIIRAQAVADEDALKRFLREAQLASRLNHPNLVSIIDFGQTADGLLYLVMELCLGRSLEKRISEEAPMPVADAIGLAIQICDGLGAAHKQEIIHRDLKPSNVMELDEGSDIIKLLDFGLARSLSGDHSTITRSDVILGTPTHMAPEVVRGDHYDARSDFYSLGVILYTMLMGRVPFADGSMERLLAQHVAAPIPALDPSLPPSLQRLVERLLAKEPAGRYESAAAIKEALVAVRAQLRPEELTRRAARVEMPDAATAATLSTRQQESLPAVSPTSSAVRPPRKGRAWLPLSILGVTTVGLAAWLGLQGPHSTKPALTTPLAQPAPETPPSPTLTPKPEPSPTPNPKPEPSPNPAPEPKLEPKPVAKPETPPAPDKKKKKKRATSEPKPWEKVILPQ